MTPKEKAKELVQKYNLVVLDTALGGSNKRVKQCALIAVDEMLDFRNKLYLNENSLTHQYLLNVKQEIEKL